MKKILLIAAMLTSFNTAFADEGAVQMADTGDAIVGGIIGGVIGGIIGGAIADNDHHHRPAPRHVVCYARNARGQTFRAFGRSANNVQRQAMNQCYRFSRVCRPVGCQF